MKKDILEVSENYTKTAHISKFDLRSFFMSINLNVLWKQLEKFIKDECKGDDIDILLYLTKIIVFHRPQYNCIRNDSIELRVLLPHHKSMHYAGDDRGMAIGNITSQQFANFYMSFFDVFMIWLCARYGCRYKRFVDDFAVVGDKDVILKIIRPLAEQFLERRLKVKLHRDKFYIQPVGHGVKFVGTVIMPGRKYISNRTVGGMTDKMRRTERICDKILREKPNSRNLRMLRHCISALNSYLGFTVHVNGHNLRHKIFDRASKSFWKVCYLTGDYNVVKVYKEYRITEYLKKREDAEFKQDIGLRPKRARSRHNRKKVRNETADNKL